MSIIRVRGKTKHVLHLICKIFVVTSKILRHTRIVKTVLAVSAVIFSYFGNQLGRPDMLPFLEMYNTCSSQMKCSLKFEVISIHTFVVLTIQQEGERYHNCDNNGNVHIKIMIT